MQALCKPYCIVGTLINQTVLSLHWQVFLLHAHLSINIVAQSHGQKAVVSRHPVQCKPQMHHTCDQFMVHYRLWQSHVWVLQSICGCLLTPFSLQASSTMLNCCACAQHKNCAETLVEKKLNYQAGTRLRMGTQGYVCNDLEHHSSGLAFHFNHG